MDFAKRKENWGTMLDMLSKLLDDGLKLRNTFSHDSSVGDADFSDLRIILERLLSIKNLMLIETL